MLGRWASEKALVAVSTVHHRASFGSGHGWEQCRTVPSSDVWACRSSRSEVDQSSEVSMSSRSITRAIMCEMEEHWPQPVPVHGFLTWPCSQAGPWKSISVLRSITGTKTMQYIAWRPHPLYPAPPPVSLLTPRWRRVHERGMEWLCTARPPVDRLT